jgi:hypothetical protein
MTSMVAAPTSTAGMPVLIAAHSQPCPEGYQRSVAGSAQGPCVKIVSAAREASLKTFADTGLMEAQRVAKEFSENQKEVIQIIGLSLLIAIGFWYLEK